VVATSGSGEAKITEAIEATTEAAAGGEATLTGGSWSGSAGQGDACSGSDGFEELAQSARPTLLRVAQGVTGRREDAEDAVQSSLLKAMRAWQRVAGQERWRQQAYVRQIVVNTCRSGWRKWGSRVVVGEMPEQVQGPETDALDDRELVRQALSRLPARQREVLLLRYYEDLTEAEIASRLGCAPGTVKSSAARALRALRDTLPEYAGRRLMDVAAGDEDLEALSGDVSGAGAIDPGAEPGSGSASGQLRSA
jgi:RNA polymerase sigma-70 factor (sigma-E family)